jgi:hypothetical protein
MGAETLNRRAAVVRVRPVPYERLGGVMGGACTIPIADYGIRLRAFLTFNDIELDFVAFFERFVSVQLNR